MLFLDLLITKKMPEKNWKNIDNFTKKYKILHNYVEKNWNISSQTQNIAYSLFEAELYADVKTGFILNVRQKLWILEWNM